MTIDLRTVPRDCDCVTHDVLHWLHEDRFAFEQNLRLLHQPLSQLAGLAFAQNEQIRLQNKCFAMLRYTKDENEDFIFPDGYSEKDYNARIKEALANFKVGE